MKNVKLTVAYAAPKVEVIEISVEKGYLSSFAGGENVSTGNDYGWNDEIEF